MRARVAILALCLLWSPARAGTNRALFEWQQRPGAAVILDLGYFHCRSLCGIVRADMLRALDASGLQAGRDYVLASVSIDPHDRHPMEQAVERKAPPGLVAQYRVGRQSTRIASGRITGSATSSAAPTTPRWSAPSR